MKITFIWRDTFFIYILMLHFSSIFGDIENIFNKVDKYSHTVTWRWHNGKSMRGVSRLIGGGHPLDNFKEIKSVLVHTDRF